MKRLLALVLFGLAACNPAVTDAPLFSGDSAVAREGLWAALEEGCAAPTTPDVARWPECAKPFWVSGGQARFSDSSPAAFLVAEGDPPVVQVGPFTADPQEEATGPTYMYLGARPEGAPPYARARIWWVMCPEDGEPAVPEVSMTQDECRPNTPAALRALAARTMAAGPGQRVVWIAPAEQAPPPQRS